MDVPPLPSRRAMVGPDDSQIPPALGPQGGAGAAGFGQQARNRFLCTTPSASDRARWRAFLVYNSIGQQSGALARNANDFTSTHANWIRLLSRLKLIIRLRRVVATRALVYRSCWVEETACRSLGPAS